MHRGTDAVAYFARNRANVLVVDHGLPDLDGLNVLEVIQQQSRPHRVPAIVYTAADLDFAQRERARAANASVVVKSRTSPEVLAQQVVRLFAPSTPQAAAA